MACYNPLRAFAIGVHEKSGKTKYKITSSYTDYVVKDIHDKHNDVWIAYSETQDMKDFFRKKNFKIVDEFIEIPCGKCVGCRLAKSKEWATRCMIESKFHESSFFITLTYNDESLPYNSIGFPTLVKSDLQKFMKRLRKNYPNYLKKHGISWNKDSKKLITGLRYFACGEYGPKNSRPHYHLIIFGLKLFDLKFKAESNIEERKSTDIYYTSKFIEDCWSSYNEDTGEKSSLGFHIIGNVSFESCAYVSRYVMKKANSDMHNKDYYNFLELCPEFVTMSLKPGIGKGLLDDESKCLELLEYDSIKATDCGASTPQKIPRYFNCILENDFPELFAEVKEKRIQNALDFKNAKLLTLNEPYDVALSKEEFVKINQLKKLKRDSI